MADVTVPVKRLPHGINFPLPEYATVQSAAVDLLGQRGDLLVGEAADALADHLRAFTKLEVEFRGCAHGGILLFAGAHSKPVSPRKPAGKV